MVAADANVQIKDHVESIKTISYLCHLDNVIQETQTELSTSQSGYSKNQEMHTN